VHARHVWPPLPHAPLVVPATHCPAEQHPVVQDVESHAHAPLTQRRPVPHVPVWQVPPQPSLAPHILPAQLGVQPHVPPLHASGLAQTLPGQQACPLPPHVPQLPVPQLVPLAHAVQTVPPIPHAALLVPDSHVSLLQQPEHDVASQAQTPLTQC
jgi:hypothetical protein